MKLSFRLFALLLSLFFTLSFCNCKNVTIKIVGFIDCTDCIIQDVNNNQAFLGLKVAITCKATNGEMQMRGNSNVNQEGTFNVTLFNQMNDDKKTVEGCFAKLHAASGEQCPIQTAQTASMKIIISEENKTQTADVTHKLKFSPKTCQSAFFWPFIRYKYFTPNITTQPNFTHVPEVSPPMEYSPPPPVVLPPPPSPPLIVPPPAPAPSTIDPSVPPVSYLVPSSPPSESPSSPIHYATPSPAPLGKDPYSPPVDSFPPTPPPRPPPVPNPNPPAIAPVSPKLNPPPSPMEKSSPPTETPLPPAPISPPSKGHSITIPRAPPVPKLPPIPTVPRRFFNPPKSRIRPPNPSHHLH